MTAARPGLVLPLALLALIAAGAALLKLPACVPPGQTLTWLDALFTATSAACLVGLTTHDPATGFTPVAQAIIGLLIQLGGLCVIVYGSTIALTLLGRPVNRRVLGGIALATLAIELLGAAAMFPLWEAPPGGSMGLAQRAGLSAFHAVSAFCNAGFDITGSGLPPYRYALLTHAVIAPLIVLGGLGFPLLMELADLARRRTRGLSAHGKVVLTTSAALYLYGVVAIGASQSMPYLYESLGQGQTAHVDRPGAMSLADAGRVLADASFLSITARTAGLDAMPIHEVRPAGTFALVTLMAVGGSPGGAAGGVGTTSLVVLLLAVAATLRRQTGTGMSSHAVPGEIVGLAGAVLACHAALVVAGTLLLSFSEPFPFEKLFFEAVSAAASAGLSLGVTPDLSTFGRIVVVSLMFLGRVAPLALLGSLVLANPRRRRVPVALG